MMLTGLLVLGLLAVAVAWAGKPSPPPPSLELPATSPTEFGPLLLNAEYAAGLVGPVRQFFYDWSWGGPFPLSMNGPNAGLRVGPEAEAFQAAAFARGDSNAASLADTAHGRGGAGDASVVLQGRVRASSDADPTVQRMYEEYAEKARQAGLRAGADFKSPKREPWHVEDPNWRALPYPPSRGVA